MRDLSHEEDLALRALTKHIGRINAVDMGELYREVFGKDFGHKINDTRELRRVITNLRWQGMPVCHCAQGYYLGYGSEYAEWKDRVKHQALKKLAMIAPMENLTLQELLGQMALNLEAHDETDTGTAARE